MDRFPKPVFDDAVDRKQAREAELDRKERELIEERERRRQENRRLFPEVTKFFDECEKNFPGCKVIWAIENGNVVGKPPREALIKHGLLPPDPDDQPSDQ